MIVRLKSILKNMPVQISNNWRCGNCKNICDECISNVIGWMEKKNNKYFNKAVNILIKNSEVYEKQS